MTIRNEVIALLDTVGALADRNFSDRAPESVSVASGPYTVFKDDISRTPGLEGDAQTLWWKWMGQVDYWFSLTGEDQALIDTIAHTLDGARLVDSGLRLRVTTVNRVTDALYDTGHTALTLITVRPR